MIKREKYLVGFVCSVGLVLLALFQNCASGVNFENGRDPYDALCGFVSAPAKLDRKQTENLTLRLTNTGQISWDQENGSAIQANGAAPLGVDPAVLKPPVTSPIQTDQYWDVPVKITAHQNKQAGETITLSWTMAADGVGNFGQACVRNFEVVGAKDYDSTIVSAPIVSPMQKSKEQTVIVKVKNIGLRDWFIGTDTFKFRLDSVYGVPATPDKKSELALTAAQRVKPNETIDFSLKLFSPATVGSFKAKGSMYKNADPFGAQLDQTVQVVASPTPAPTPTPTSTPAPTSTPPPKNCSDNGPSFFDTAGECNSAMGGGYGGGVSAGDCCYCFYHNNTGCYKANFGWNNHSCMDPTPRGQPYDTCCNVRQGTTACWE